MEQPSNPVKSKTKPETASAKREPSLVLEPGAGVLVRILTGGPAILTAPATVRAVREGARGQLLDLTAKLPGGLVELEGVPAEPAGGATLDSQAVFPCWARASG